MATIDSWEAIDQIMAADGLLFQDEPPVVRIVEYVTPEGHTTWGVIYAGEDGNSYRASEFILDPRVIFERVDVTDDAAVRVIRLNLEAGEDHILRLAIVIAPPDKARHHG